LIERIDDAETPGLSDFEVLSAYALFTRTGAPKSE